MKAFRHELKYLINRLEMDDCIKRLDLVAAKDVHATSGRYFIRSLYYDDMYRTAYNEKESGVSSRHKFRIRIYDLDDSYIALEKKIKEGSYVRKESATLTKEQYCDIIRGDTAFLLHLNSDVAREFATEVRLSGLSPAVIVDYDRIPYVYETGDVRITFDMNIRAAMPEGDIFRSDLPSYEVFGQDLLVMEVKYTQLLPDIFRAMLPAENCRMAVSKYVNCMDKMNDISGGYIL